MQLGGVLQAFLTALRSLNGALQTDLPWFSTLLNHKPLSLAAGWSSRQRSFPALHLRELTEERREEEKIRLFQSLHFQGILDCLSETLTLLLRGLPLEVQHGKEYDGGSFPKVSVSCTSQVSF